MGTGMRGQIIEREEIQHRIWIWKEISELEKNSMIFQGVQLGTKQEVFCNDQLLMDENVMLRGERAANRVE